MWDTTGCWGLDITAGVGCWGPVIAFGVDCLGAGSAARVGGRGASLGIGTFLACDTMNISTSSIVYNLNMSKIIVKTNLPTSWIGDYRTCERIFA